MKTKTFKIGEYAIGGIIKVDIIGKIIIINCLDYVSKKQILSGSVSIDDFDWMNKVEKFLNELTTSYYSDKIFQWIESKIT